MTYITLDGNYLQNSKDYSEIEFIPHFLSIFHVLRIVLGTRDTKVSWTLHWCSLSDRRWKRHLDSSVFEAVHCIWNLILNPNKSHYKDSMSINTLKKDSE